MIKAQERHDVNSSFTPAAPGMAPDLSLEIEPREPGEPLRLPVHLKSLSSEGVILEGVDPAQHLQVQRLRGQPGSIHLAPDGFTQSPQIRGKVTWVRDPESRSANFLLGLELEKTDRRAWRFLEKLLVPRSDISELWNHWDRIRAKPIFRYDPVIYYVGLGSFLGGLALHFTLPDPYGIVGCFLAFYGSLIIAGKSLWNWWRDRSRKLAETT